MSIGIILLTVSPVSILAKSFDSQTKYLNAYKNNEYKYVFNSVNMFCAFTVQTLANGIMGLHLSQSRERSSNLVRFSR